MFTIWTRGITLAQQIGYCGDQVSALCSTEISEGRAVKCGNGYAIYSGICANGGTYNVT